MSKIIYLIIIAGLAVVVVAAINTHVVDARQQTEFIQVSVLAEHQADYGVDEQVIAIPAVSVDIIEDAAQDFQAQSSVRVITYTSLPTKVPRPDREEEEGSDSVDETKHNNGQGNGNQGNNGNGGSPQRGVDGSGNQNQNGNANGNGLGNNNKRDRDKQDKPKKEK